MKTVFIFVNNLIIRNVYRMLTIESKQYTTLSFIFCEQKHFGFQVDLFRSYNVHIVQYTMDVYIGYTIKQSAPAPPAVQQLKEKIQNWFIILYLQTK